MERYHPANLVIRPALKHAAAQTLPDYPEQKLRVKSFDLPLLADLSDAWTASADFASFKPSTRARYELELGRILRQFGKVPLVAIETPQMRERFLAWRDSRASTPRAADEGVRVLRRLIQFGLVHGYLYQDPTASIKELWLGASNAHVYWTEEDIASFQKEANSLRWPQVGWAVRLMAGTGLSLPEAIALQWSDLDETTIRRPTNDGGVREAKQRCLIRLPQLEPLLDELRDAPKREHMDFVLLNRSGRRWHRVLLYKHATPISHAANIYHEDTETGELTLKTFKDLQRTFAVRLMKLTNESDDTIASLFNWKAEDVAILRSVAAPDTR